MPVICGAVQLWLNINHQVIRGLQQVDQHAAAEGQPVDLDGLTLLRRWYRRLGR